ncbi:MAG: type II secretion system minor pseudopilin GspK [Myxococcota bacterium]
MTFGARARHQHGVVLLIVLFFALLLTSAVATFTRRSIVDAMVARNRDASGRAEALARGGVRLATAYLVQDKIAKASNPLPIETHLDLWAQLGSIEIPVAEGTTLRINIEDSGSLFNLNSVFDYNEGEFGAFQQTIPFLQDFFEKVIDEIVLPPGERVYDVTELSEALIDWVDSDTERLAGGYEDDYYQQQDPPYRAQNGPIRSVDDLLLVEGFDRQLVAAIRPYVTVFPLAAARGVNPNTAPPHVLSLLFFNDGVDHRLAKEDEVKQILKIRDEGGVLCDEGISHELCTPINSIVANEIFPPSGYSSSTFTITADAEVEAIKRSVVAVIDRDQQPPLLLSWKIR